MKVLIEIDEKFYQWVKICGIMPFITAGKVIPDNATNGDVIKAMFPSMNVANDQEWFIHLQDGKGNIIKTSKEWWDAPYKGETHENKFPEGTRMGAGLRDSKAEKGDKKNDNPL